MHKTPFYQYDLTRLQQDIDCLSDDNSGFSNIYYALKANVEKEVIARIKRAGYGVDCVSGGEVQLALDSGFLPSQILLSGVGKANWEIELAIANQIKCLHIESVEEIGVIDEIAKALDRRIDVAFRLNPDIDAKTHNYISTGMRDSKFGIQQPDLNAALSAYFKSSQLNLIGIHIHVGSQITDMSVFDQTAKWLASEAARWLSEGINLSYLNFGGGLGVDYQYGTGAPSFKEWLAPFKRELSKFEDVEKACEPGRSIVASSGRLITKVLFQKNGPDRNMLVVDAGMTELIRPALYGAIHPIEKLNGGKSFKQYDIHGPICESSDCFGKAIWLPDTQRGDVLAIKMAGAYGQTMNSCYNQRVRKPAVFSQDEAPVFLEF